MILYIILFHTSILDISFSNLQIQERTGAKVKFRDDDKEQEERVLLVRGTHESSQKAELIIKKIIADQPPIIEDTITVPNRCLGRIIGIGSMSSTSLFVMSEVKTMLLSLKKDTKL